MKILIFTSEFIPFPGGVASHSLCLVNGLYKLGHDITIITKKYKEQSKTKKIDVVLTKKGITCVRLLYVKKLFLIIWRVYLKRHLAKEHYDIIILNDTGAQLVVSEKKIFQCLHNYCIFVHGRGIEKYFNKKKLPYRFFYNNNYLKKLFIKAAPLITNSNSMKKWLLMHFPNTDIQVIHNCINSENFFYKTDFEQKKLKLKKEYGLSENEKILLTASRLVEYKGHDILIDVFSQLLKKNTNVRLIIAGSGSYKKNLQKQIYNLNLQKKIIFTGALGHEKLRDLYQLADIFILLSKTEPFGLVFLEANACKTPVIGSDIDGIREAIQNNVSGFLVNPIDKDSILLKINALLKDSSLNHKIGQSGYERIINCYTEKVLTEKLLKAIKEHQNG